jgi:undecaprenyl-diphosphatase
MSDTSVFLWINGLAGKVTVFDEFFKGIANDYFALITGCLVLIWLWFATRDVVQREKNQRAVLWAMASIGIVCAMMMLINNNYFKLRPFDVLPGDSINLLFYKPTDSSFPSNIAAVIFALAIPIFIKNKRYGSWLLALAILTGFGRIYIGVHFPLDVVSGVALGALASFISLGILRIIKPLPDFVLKILHILYLA